MPVTAGRWVWSEATSKYAANEYFLGYTGTGKTATLPYVWRWKKARVVNSTTYTDGVTIT